MVRARVGDDELAGALHHARERDAVLLEERGGDEQLLVSEKLGARAPHLGNHALRQNLEALAVLRRDGVPKFRRAVVQVVDRVQVHVLRVPREERAPHAKVEVRRVHAVEGDPTLFKRAREQTVQLRHVPAPVVAVEERAGDVRAVRGGVIRHLLPELALERGVRLILQRRLGRLVLGFRSHGFKVVLDAEGFLLHEERAEETLATGGVLRWGGGRRRGGGGVRLGRFLKSERAIARGVPAIREGRETHLSDGLVHGEVDVVVPSGARRPPGRRDDSTDAKLLELVLDGLDVRLERPAHLSHGRVKHRRFHPLGTAPAHGVCVSCRRRSPVPQR